MEPKHLFMSSEHSHQLLFEFTGEVEGESLNNFMLLAVTVLLYYENLHYFLLKRQKYLLGFCCRVCLFFG